jgi:subtilisin family serine protease
MILFGFLPLKKNPFPVILILLIPFVLTACSSGKSNPVVPPSGEFQFANKSELVKPDPNDNSKIYEPIEIPLDEITRTSAGKNIDVLIKNLTYDLNEGWASFDLSLINHGPTLFDTQLTVESISQNGKMLVDQGKINSFKLGIIPKGIKSVSRHIEITFQPGKAPVVSGHLLATTKPLFQNKRTVLHTDKLADHGRDYSSFSGQIIADQVLLRFRTGTALDAQYELLDTMRLLPVGVNLSTKFVQADILNGLHPDDVVRNLLKQASIDHAEVNTVNFIQSFPNDPIFNPDDPAWEGDGINSWGQRRIQAPEAWDFYNDRVLDQIGDVDVAYDSNAPIIMFICDTGYKFHTDLAIDSTDEEFLNLGLNIVNPEQFPADDHGHGTLISGIAMGEGNNGIGMAGMAWNAHIVPIKTNDYAGNGDEFRSGIAISYAKEVALDYPDYRCVGNMSYGTHSRDHTVDRVNEASAFKDAWPVENLQFVSAAGNCNNTPNPDPGHPCYYPFPLTADNFFPSSFPWVVGVAATKRDTIGGLDTEAGYTNYGYTVDVSAPGSDIYSTWIENDSSYRRASGTSCASPNVAGLFALLWSRNPSLNKTEIKNIILKTADPMSVPSYKEHKLGTGRINAFKALFSARYTKPLVGEKLSSGDIDGDALDETALGINSSFRNTGRLLVFRQDREITGNRIVFGLDSLVIGSSFGDIDNDNADEIMVLLLKDAGGIFEVDNGSSNLLELVKLDYHYPDFTQSTLYSFGTGMVSEFVTTGDFDGDSDSEIAVLVNDNPTGYFAIPDSGNPANNSSIEIIDGNGTLLNSIPIGSDTLGTALVTGDVDNDGKDEIVLGYVYQPSGIYSGDINEGTNTGKLLIIDNPASGTSEILTGYIPTQDRIIEQILVTNLDTDPARELVISTLDYPSGYFERQQILNDAAIVVFDDSLTGVNEIARLDFDDTRMTFALTEGNIHPNENDQFWGWFTINPIGVDYADNPVGGSLLMVPFGLDGSSIVQRGASASSGGGYRHFSGCVRNGDLDSPNERNETALYAIESKNYQPKRYFEYHDDIGSNIYITWDYRFPLNVVYYEPYVSLTPDAIQPKPIEP